MKTHARFSFKGFDSEIKTTVLIGGEENFCKERFGYRQTEKGLQPGMFPVAVEPSLRISNMVFAEYCPALGFILLTTRQGQVARWNSDTYSKLTTAAVVNPNYPFVVACADGDAPTYAVIGGTRIAIFKGAEVSTYTLPYRVVGGTYHCGRIFAVDNDDPYLIRWSGFALRDWALSIDGGGHMRVSPKGGKVLKIVELGEKLVLVRECGLTVMNALADARHFRLVQYGTLFLPAVIDKTSVVVGGKLWLCTEEGLYVYDGSSVSYVELDTCGKNYSFERAVAFRDRYIYFTCTDDCGRCFLEYDVRTGATLVFAKGCNMFFCTDDALYCLSGDAVTTVSRLTYGEEDVNRVWLSENIDLGTCGAKTLKYITVEGDGRSVIEIECDGRRRTVDGKGKIYVGEVGVNFTFGVRGTGSITRLVAEWEVRK